jgi:hypothetical protein
MVEKATGGDYGAAECCYATKTTCYKKGFKTVCQKRYVLETNTTYGCILPKHPKNVCSDIKKNNIVMFEDLSLE